MRRPLKHRLHQSLQLTDDRGQAHPYSADLTLTPSADPRLRAIRRQQTILITPSVWRLSLLIFILFVAMVAFRLPPMFSGFAISALIAIAILVTSIRARRRIETDSDGSGQRWVNAALRRGICPVCEYNLHGLAAEDDGCIICTECAAAWKRDRIKRSSPASESSPVSWWTLGTERLQAARLVDDAAVCHRAPHLCELAPIAPLSPEGRQRLAAAAASLRPRGRLKRLVNAGVLLAFAAASLVIIVVDRATADAFKLVVTAIFLWLAVAALRSDIGISGALRTRVLREAGFCPVCGSELQRGDETAPGRALIDCLGCDAKWHALAAEQSDDGGAAPGKGA